MSEPVVMIDDTTARVQIGAQTDVESLAAVVDRLTASGVTRVEALVPLGERGALRAAARVGLRREGVRRSLAPSGDVVEQVVVARLATDPAPHSGPGFRAVLNAGLNRTRVIAQGLAENESGAVLLCQLTYKRFWDLPGGVVDPHESPATALEREIREETGVVPRIGPLVAVNWLPPWQGWDDACLFVFAVEVPHDICDIARLEAREIAALHWRQPGELADHVADYTARMMSSILERRHDATAHGPAYLEDGLTRPTGELPSAEWSPAAR